MTLEELFIVELNTVLNVENFTVKRSEAGFFAQILNRNRKVYCLQCQVGLIHLIYIL